jgi:hypothetical protein
VETQTPAKAPQRLYRALSVLIDHLRNHLVHPLLLLGVKDGAFHGVFHIQLLREAHVERVDADQEDEGEG